MGNSVDLTVTQGPVSSLYILSHAYTLSVQTCISDASRGTDKVHTHPQWSLLKNKKKTTQKKPQYFHNWVQLHIR